MARNENAEQRREEARRREEDRDRLKTIELSVVQIEKAINGERGVISRMDNHGDRLRKIETVMTVGSVAFTAVGVVLVYAKDIVITWAKKKIGGGA